MVEAAFRLSQNSPEPFAEELWARVEDEAGGGVWVPAFYDGDGIWRVRYTPAVPGRFRLDIFAEREGVREARAVVDLQPREFEVSGSPRSTGFVRLHPENPRAFQRQAGRVFFPLGMNVGWDNGEPGGVEGTLEKLAAAGGNWSRIWMCHWDEKNPDWIEGGANRPGEMDLAVARKWDRIVATADRLGIVFQFVLHHHGQFSTTVNPNWQEHPWNKVNGGFLERPEDFFTDEKALALTRRKFRYVVARYGHSPAVMAWELFNEVEFTDAAKTPDGRRAILEWHQKMAAWLRSLDPCHHLITTSAPELESPIWMVADYYQQHAYPPDPLSGAGGFDVPPESLAKPVFYGEIGPMDPSGSAAGDGGLALRNVLWSGMFSGAAGAAQFWAWDQVVREDLFSLIKAAARFVEMAQIGEGVWRPVPARAATEGRADLVVGPGQRWNSVIDPRLVLAPDGGSRPWGAGWSATLRPRRGSGEREGTDAVTFRIGTQRAVRAEVTVGEVSAFGAALNLEVNAKVMVSRSWEAQGREAKPHPLPEVITVDLPENGSSLTLRSVGPDFVRLASLRLKDYTPELGLRAMTNDLAVVVWVYREAALTHPPLGGQAGVSRGPISLEGLLDGTWKLLWWDTARAVAVEEGECRVEKGRAEIFTPPVATDLALLLSRRKAP